jgi:hypothetical protein
MTDLRGEISPFGGTRHLVIAAKPSRRSQQGQQIQSIAHWDKKDTENHSRAAEWKSGCLNRGHGDRTMDGK